MDEIQTDDHDKVERNQNSLGCGRYLVGRP